MIRLRNVTKTYNKNFNALNRINLHICKDEFVFLVGPTGAGKTTLLKLVMRDELPDSGSVYIDKINTHDFNENQVAKLRKNIGVIFQDFKILYRTVYENLAFVLKIQGEKKKVVREKIESVISLVGLESKLHCYPHQLSGGEQQKACLARAIINKPTILLADEPTGNLDPDSSWELMQILKKINQAETTIVVATHDKTVVDLMRKRVVALHAGNIIRDEQLGSYHES
ncbi:MAG: cell division ATP-binding protein FtsE [Candidatus Margulisbacteria bacterium]|nr:cell division ATP-binding protein FtsE [Candidatus Margulisiibacteriota bacterium]